MTLYPSDGGAARHVIDVVSGLNPEEWAVDVACLPGSDPWRELEGRQGVVLHPLSGRHGRPKPRDALDWPLLLRLVAAADVVHAHASKAGFLTRLAAAPRGRRRATVFTPHAWGFWAAEGNEARLYLVLERLAARWCRTIVTVSQFERDAGLAAGVGRPEQYRVIHNGIDLGRYGAAPNPVPGRIVMVGRLAPPKRPGLAVRALAEIRRALPKAHLDLVGDGPLRNEVESLAVAQGVREAVRLLGTRKDVPDLLSGAACFLLASDYEGCPLSVLEAMAAGVPVVATAVGGVGELVVDGETGVLVEPGRPDLLAAALEALLREPDRALSMGAAGRARAQARFSRDRMVRETVALYESVASG